MDALIGLGLTALLLVVTFFIGQKGERDHFEDLRRREARLRSMPVTTFETLPPDWTPITSGIVTGSVVMSADYFKQFVAGFKKFFGGRLTVLKRLISGPPLLAVASNPQRTLFMKHSSLINVRIEGSRINRSGTQKEGVVAVEMLAYGTGIKRGRKPVSKAPLPAV